MSGCRVLKRIGEAHTDAIWCVSWSSRFGIVTGSVDETAKRWKEKEAAPPAAGASSSSSAAASSGAEFASAETIKNLLLGVVSIATHPAHSIAALSSLDSQIRLWDMEKGSIKNVDCGPIDCWTLCFSHDGRFIASGTYNGAICIWDVAKGTLEDKLQAKDSFILSVAWSQNGTRLACGGKDGAVFIFDLRGESSSSSSSSASAEASAIESGGSAKRLIATLQTHALAVRALCFSPDSTMLFSGSDDASVSIYNIVSGNIVGTLRGHLSWVLCVQVSPDGRMVATSSSDKSVKLWDISPEAIAASSANGGASTSAQAIHPQRQQAGFGKCLHSFDKAHSDEVFGLAFSPEGTRLASVGGDGVLQIYAVGTS